VKRALLSGFTATTAATNPPSPKATQGKTIRCPKCYYIIHIPKAQPKATKPNKNGSEQIKTAPKHSDYDLTLLDISEKERIQNLQAGIHEETDEYEQELEGRIAGRNRTL